MPPNIQDMWDKFKSLLADDAVYYSLVLALVAGVSFGLGRLSVLENKQIPEKISEMAEKPAVAAVIEGQSESDSSKTTVLETKTETVLYVGSKNSNKYHLPWCSGAQRIAEANKVYFASKAQAQAAGYSPAANCQGI